MNTCKQKNKIRYWNEKQSVQIVQAALFVYTRSIANLVAMALPFAGWHEKKHLPEQVIFPMITFFLLFPQPVD